MDRIQATSKIIPFGLHSITLGKNPEILEKQLNILNFQVLRIVLLSREVPFHVSVSEAVCYFFGLCGTSFIFAILFSAIFEMPFLALQKLCFPDFLMK